MPIIFDLQGNREIQKLNAMAERQDGCQIYRKQNVVCEAPATSKVLANIGYFLSVIFVLQCNPEIQKIESNGGASRWLPKFLGSKMLYVKHLLYEYL